MIGFTDVSSMHELAQPRLARRLLRELAPAQQRRHRRTATSSSARSARLAGVAHTDWSWSALFADFDNDGRKDIFIGNGYPKAVNDLDYMTTTATALRPGRAQRHRNAPGARAT